MIDSLSASRSLYANPRVAESYAIMIAANFYKEIDIQLFILKGDALQVVNSFSMKNPN